jgi:zinc transporter, ZIP family
MATMLGGLIVTHRCAKDPRTLAFGLAFAAGAMVYISLVEIFAKSYLGFAQVLVPDKLAYAAATGTFFIGVLLMVLLDRVLPHPDEAHAGLVQSADQHLHRLGLFAAFAIIAHNFPEGMATFFAALNTPVSGSAMALAIALHNIPEGLSIAIPVYFATGKRRYALLLCLIAALAEPVGALLGYVALRPWLSPAVFATVFGIIAGVMVFLALLELLPAAQRAAAGRLVPVALLLGMGVIAASLVLLRP